MCKFNKCFITTQSILLWLKIMNLKNFIPNLFFNPVKTDGRKGTKMSKREDGLSYPLETQSFVNYCVSYPRTWSHTEDRSASYALPNTNLSDYKEGLPLRSIVI